MSFFDDSFCNTALFQVARCHGKDMQTDRNLPLTFLYEYVTDLNQGPLNTRCVSLKYRL